MMIVNIVCKKNTRLNTGLFFESEGRKTKPIQYTENQKLLLRKLQRKSTDDSKLVFVTGPPGSGKTMVACKNAFKQLNNMEIDKFMLIESGDLDNLNGQIILLEVSNQNQDEIKNSYRFFAYAK